MIVEADIRALMRARNWRQIELAAAAGVTQPTVSRWLAGQVPDPSAQERLAVLAAESALAPRRGEAVKAQFIPPPAILGERDLPVYAAVEGGPGEITVSTDPIDMVPRPWYLGSVRDGYAVLVVGESMVPAFRPGEMAIVNPRLAPLRNKDHILVKEAADGSFRATIKHLLNWSDEDWKLEQFNPPPGAERVFTLSRQEWRKALRVVGKYDG
jgi:transcriptional regulator with XRE-family HTH domain